MRGYAGHDHDGIPFAILNVMYVGIAPDAVVRLAQTYFEG